MRIETSELENYKTTLVAWNSHVMRVLAVCFLMKANALLENRRGYIYLAPPPK